MTHPDLLALLEEGVQNGRITPYLAAYIAAELHNGAMNAAPDDDQEARAALTPADRRALPGESVH
jgi:hypothetical protein